MLAYLDTLSNCLVAVENGDVDAIRAAMPTIGRGALLILDRAATIYRSRARR